MFIPYVWAKDLYRLALYVRNRRCVFILVDLIVFVNVGTSLLKDLISNRITMQRKKGRIKNKCLYSKQNSRLEVSYRFLPITIQVILGFILHVLSSYLPSLSLAFKHLFSFYIIQIKWAFALHPML